MNLAIVLQQAWTSPFFVKGDFARFHAIDVACAASLGLITTQLAEDTFGRQWLITATGLDYLHAQET